MTRFVVDLGGRSFTVTLDGAMASVNGRPPVTAHVEQVEGTPVRLVTIGTTVHRVTARRDGERGRYILRIDGHRYDVDALDERTRAIRDMADANRAHAGPVPLVAPMPGLVVRVHVAAGDVVAAGQGLVSIEAMKMENELRAVAAGTVRRVVAAVGTAVEKGAVLVEFD
ncbi:MAG TPA: biotin/lipoyl-containing protein [Gemmatimonadaceae bacterium]|nr:biotin/lipoyl-containing protein [Gemmatimonadaceae bacterium]